MGLFFQADLARQPSHPCIRRLPYVQSMERHLSVEQCTYIAVLYCEAIGPTSSLLYSERSNSSSWSREFGELHMLVGVEPKAGNICHVPPTLKPVQRYRRPCCCCKGSHCQSRSRNHRASNWTAPMLELITWSNQC